MKIIYFKWCGTNSIIIYDDKKSIIVDPFIRYDKRFDDSYIKELSQEKNILITHGHVDHVLYLPYLYKNKKCKIYCMNSVYKRLLKRNIDEKNLVKINYDDNFKIDDFNVDVLKSKHIKFDFKLIINTLFSYDVIKYFKNLIFISYNHFKNPLKKEIVSYLINYKNKSVFIMGSMNLDENTIYPKNVDYLFLAYQGRSDLHIKIKDVLSIIKPKKVILTHFDNSFPPISKDINLSKLIDLKDYDILIPEHEKEYKL